MAKDPLRPDEPVSVVIRVRPAFLGLFRPADLEAIAGLNQQRLFGAPKRTYVVSGAPTLVDPFARTDLGGGSEAMQLVDAIAEALYPVSALKLPDVCRALGLDDDDTAHQPPREGSLAA